MRSPQYRIVSRPVDSNNTLEYDIQRKCSFLGLFEYWDFFEEFSLYAGPYDNYYEALEKVKDKLESDYRVMVIENRKTFSSKFEPVNDIVFTLDNLDTLDSLIKFHKLRETGVQDEL